MNPEFHQAGRGNLLSPWQEATEVQRKYHEEWLNEIGHKYLLTLVHCDGYIFFEMINRGYFHHNVCCCIAIMLFRSSFRVFHFVSSKDMRRYLLFSPNQCSINQCRRHRSNLERSWYRGGRMERDDDEDYSDNISVLLHPLV